MAEIRLAEAHDIPAIAEIMQHAAETSVATFTIHPRSAAEWQARWEKARAFYPWLVAEADGQVAGYAKSGPFRDNDAYAWSVEVSVYLRPAHQRKGVGRRLYERLFALLHLQGYHRAFAIVVTENPESIAFHERVGMRRCGAVEGCGYKFGRFLGITYFDLRLQDDHQKPGRILTVDEVTQG